MLKFCEMLEYIFRNPITDFKLQKKISKIPAYLKVVDIFLLILPFVELGAYPMDSPALQQASNSLLPKLV